MKVTRKQLEEIIKEETEKILRGEPLEIQLLQKVLRDKMTPEEAKKRLPIGLHKKFDYYLAKNKKLQKELPNQKFLFCKVNSHNLSRTSVRPQSGISRTPQSGFNQASVGPQSGFGLTSVAPPSDLSRKTPVRP